MSKSSPQDKFLGSTGPIDTTIITEPWGKLCIPIYGVRCNSCDRWVDEDEFGMDKCDRCGHPLEEREEPGTPEDAAWWPLRCNNSWNYQVVEVAAPA